MSDHHRGSDVCDACFARLGGLSERWRTKADGRRELDPNDVPANTLVHCAGELDEEVVGLRELTDLLSVEQWASHHDVTPQTVRNWIKAGKLEVFETARGVRIPRKARRSDL